MDKLTQFMSAGLALYGVIVFLFVREAPYGRYAKHGYGGFVSARKAWFLQEAPAFFMPLLMMRAVPDLRLENIVVLSLFVLHYFQRTFIFSWLIKGKPSPLMVVVAAFLFCLFNGYLQARYILYEAFYPVGYLSSGRFQLGLLVFIAGMAINIHSDHILRNLRRGTSDRGYKIPKGGLFEYVSAANYFGEIVEWCGYAILVNAAPAYAFAIFSACYLGCRGCEHHQFYLKQFSNYPKNRKAIIPFLI